MPKTTIKIYAMKKNVEAIFVVNYPEIDVATKNAIINDKIGQTVR